MKLTKRSRPEDGDDDYMMTDLVRKLMVMSIREGSGDPLIFALHKMSVMPRQSEECWKPTAVKQQKSKMMASSISVSISSKAEKTL